MKKYNLVVKDKETNAVAKIDVLEFIKDPSIEFEFNDDSTLPYKDLLFFLDDFELSIEEVEEDETDIE